MPRRNMTETYLLDPRHAGDQDVVGFGEDLSPRVLSTAYAGGIFPWPIRDEPLLWFSPRERAVIDFNRLHISRSLARLKRKAQFTFTIDKAFGEVVAGCQAAPRSIPGETWITPAMRNAYIALHDFGCAHSIEAWDNEGRLVGGLYGVSVGGIFTGESLFYREPNASKLALLHLIDHLAARGLAWLDIQVITPHMEVLGAHVISRGKFLDRLDRERARHLSLFD